MLSLRDAGCRFCGGGEELHWTLSVFDAMNHVFKI